MSTQYPASPAPEASADTPFGVVDLLTWMGDGKRTIAAWTLLAIVASVTYSLLTPNEYTARTTLLPPNTQQQNSSTAALAALGSLGGLTSSIPGKTPDELYVQLLRSDTVQRKLDQRFDLKKRYDVKTNEALRAEMFKQIKVTSDKKSGLVTVDVEDPDPKFAAELANAHSTEITSLLSRLAVTEAQQRRVFFELQLKETKDNLIRAEQALRQVQEKSGMVVLDKQAEAIIAAVAQVKTRITEREIQLRVLRTSTTAENPEVRMLSSELAALKAELARMESNGVTDGKVQREGGIDIPVGKLPSTAVDYVRAAREVKFQETMLGSMLRQFEVAKMDESKDSPALQQVDVAMPPERKSKPMRTVIVLAATLAAFLLSSAWVVFRRYTAAASEMHPGRARAMDALKRSWRLRGAPQA